MKLNPINIWRKFSSFIRTLTAVFILTFLQAGWAEGADPRIEKIDKEVEKIEAYKESHKDQLKIFQVMEKDGSITLAQVAKPTNEESEATYYILEDRKGKVLYHKKAPISMSGDFYESRIHYFDKEERTIMYKYHQSWFANCAKEGILRIDHSFYFDSNSELILKKEVVSEIKPDPVSAKMCETGINHTISKNWAALKKEVSKDLERFKKERAFNTCRENLEPTLRFSKKGRNLCFELLD